MAVRYSVRSGRRGDADFPSVGPFARRFSVPLEQIRFVDTRPSAGDAGSILFKETATRDGEGGTTISREGFVAIADVDRVDRLLRQAIEQTTVAS
jgi:hypothetical protein